ncbi:MAG: hypothetical protein JJT89_07750 [Nitriliruptoraceae bacterium]|nr:hypothetical protein [Nitriliruptoraceae bacterium]
MTYRLRRLRPGPLRGVGLAVLLALTICAAGAAVIAVMAGVARLVGA